MARQLVIESAASLNGTRGHGVISQGGTPGSSPPLKPICRQQYLHRFGSAATLMTVESFETPDGSLRICRTFAPWPGL